MTSSTPSVLLLATCLAVLAACSSRGMYEGLQKSEELRQDRAPGAPGRTAPEVDYDLYQAERERLKTGGSQ